MYTACVCPVLTYGHPLFIGATPQQLETLFRTDCPALRIIRYTPTRTSNLQMYRLATFPLLQDFLTNLNSRYKHNAQNRRIFKGAFALVNARTKPNSRCSSISLNHFLPAPSQARN